MVPLSRTQSPITPAFSEIDINSKRSTSPTTVTHFEGDPLLRGQSPITPVFSEIDITERSIDQSSMTNLIHLEREPLARVIASDFILELSLLSNEEFLDRSDKDGYLISLLKCSRCAASCLERIHPFFYYFTLGRYYYLTKNKEKAFECFLKSMEYQQRLSDKLEHRYREELLVASYGYATLCTDDSDVVSQLLAQFSQGIKTLFGERECKFPLIKELLLLLKPSAD